MYCPGILFFFCFGSNITRWEKRLRSVKLGIRVILSYNIKVSSEASGQGSAKTHTTVQETNWSFIIDHTLYYLTLHTADTLSYVTFMYPQQGNFSQRDMKIFNLTYKHCRTIC